MADIKDIINEILARATALKDKYTGRTDAKAAWVCIFAQNDKEYEELISEAEKMGEIFEQTATGPKILLNESLAGTVRILKIRKPDASRLERGDADFTIDGYQSFKNEYLGKDNFKLISREGFEMIELTEPGMPVRTYFSHPPIEEQYRDILTKK